MRIIWAVLGPLSRVADDAATSAGGVRSGVENRP